MTIFIFKKFCKHKLTTEHTGIFTIYSLWVVLNYSLLTLSNKPSFSRFAQCEQIGNFTVYPE